MRVGVLASVGLSLALLGGCEDPTSISVRVTADLPCAALRGIRIEAASPGAPTGASTTTERCIDGAPEATVGTLVLVPQSDKSARLIVTVVAGVDRPVAECDGAGGYTGCVVARRDVQFVAGREIDLPIALRAQCKSVPCGAATTCVRGACRSAEVVDPSRCVEQTCSEDTLPLTTDLPAPAPDGGVPDATTLSEGGGPQADGGPTTLTCGASEKICGGACVSAADPRYGCTAGGCDKCVGLDEGDYACVKGLCTLVGCNAGFKECGGTCVPRDVAHGCGEASCTPCDATNGTPSCGTSGACTLTCNGGYKLCGGRCVSVSDPTYGCSTTGCSAAACPAPGGGTLICNGTSCEIGACPNGTKNCNQKCVPTDALNGCTDLNRCSACAQDQACIGAPAVCTCVPEPPQATCGDKGFNCGTRTNNCGQPVNCGTCSLPSTCGGGNPGTANKCGCTPTNPCVGFNCGTRVNNCGTSISCGTCSPATLCGAGGVGANVCCVPRTTCGNNCNVTEPDGCGGTINCAYDECTCNPCACGGCGCD